MDRIRPIHAHGRARRVKTRADAPLGVAIGPRRGVASEAAIVELLLAQAWSADIARIGRAEAERQAHQALERLVEQGLGFARSASGERRFDPGEVLNFAEWLSLERGDRFWLDVCVSNARAFVWAAHGLSPEPGGRPPPPLALRPRRFTVRLSRLFNLQGREPGAPTRLRLPLPIEDDALREVDLRILPTDEKVDFTVAEARLDARLPVPASRQVELGFEVSFTARPSGGARPFAPLDPDSVALYTRPREGFIRISEAIRRLAVDTAGGAVDDWTQVQRFWSFIFDRLKFGMVNYDEVDLAAPNDWVLENGWTDCQLGSALLAALCRARGIPARMISGYVLDDVTPYYHYWVEAWIADRGWVPLDTLCWYYSSGGCDPNWRDYYLGQLDYRMKTECLPRMFNGAGSIRFPKRWDRLSRLRPPGLEFGLYASDSGALIYRDRVAIIEQPSPRS